MQGDPSTGVSGFGGLLQISLKCNTKGYSCLNDTFTKQLISKGLSITFFIASTEISLDVDSLD